MKIIIISNQNSTIFHNKNSILNALSPDKVSIIFRAGSEDILSKIFSMHPDLLITTDLEGFDISTLTGGFTYNLLKIRQLHLLLTRDSIHSNILSCPLSLRMDFICKKETDAEEIRKNFPDIPAIYSFEKLPDNDLASITRKLFNVI